MHIINDATPGFEVAYNVDKGVLGSWCIQPAIAEMDTFDILTVLDLHE
jgi:hypothetical protein